jgi:phosphate acetyltransferase
VTTVQASTTDYIENRTFDEIEVGDSARLVRTLRQEDIQMYAIMSGDINPSHVDPEYAHSSMLREVIAHGMWGGALISNVLGTQFPGPGTVYVDQTLHFDHPVRVGDTVTVTITCEKKFPRNHHMIFDCVCTNQDGQKVITGTAEVLAPTEKVKRPKANLPDFKLSETRKARFEHLLEITRGLAAGIDGGGPSL